MIMAATTLTDRAVIRLSGDDVRGFLQGLVTSDVTGVLPVWAGLLTPQGKCLFDFIVWSDGEDLLFDCEAEAADDLIKRLTVYRIRRQIRFGRDELVFGALVGRGRPGHTRPAARRPRQSLARPDGRTRERMVGASPSSWRLRRPSRAR